MQCQGECHKTGECAGVVQKVSVYGYGLFGWAFTYCDTAIAVDRARGFTVKLDAEQTEGDLEQRESEQEQAARLAEQNAKLEGNPRTIQEQINREVELFGELVEPFGPNWQRDMMGYNKFDLVQALKNCLQRAEKSRQGERAADAEIVRLQAENNRLRMESGEMFTELSAHHSTPEAKEARILAWGEVDRLKAVVDAKDAEIVRLRAELAAYETAARAAGLRLIETI